MRVIAIDGLPVVDAKRPVRITVTKNDVAKADTKHPENCAAARACVRDLHALEARVHLARVYIRMNQSNWQRYQTPQILRSEIIAFDRGGTFEPQDFILEPLKHYTTGKRQGSIPKTRSGKKRRSPMIIKNVRTGPAPHDHS
jgi:hypothetical protein